MTRQRVRPSLQLSTYLKCPYCEGTGMVKSPESAAIEIIRILNVAAARNDIRRIELSVSPLAADFLLNRRRAVISRIEADTQKQIIIRPDETCPAEQNRITCFDDREGIVKI
jgi:ribonuclease E